MHGARGLAILTIAAILHLGATKTRSSLRRTKPVLTAPEQRNSTFLNKLYYDDVLDRKPVAVEVRRTKTKIDNNGDSPNTPDSDVRKPLVEKAPFIIGGKISVRGQFPWLVGLDIDDDFFCGGSLITLIHVLTAGHCAHDSKKFRAYVGAQDREANEQGRVVLTTSSKVVHPRFNSDSLQNDVAIVTLPQRMRLNNLVKTIKLPSSTRVSQSFLGAKGVVAGWGRTSDDEEEVSTKLYSANLQVVPLENCMETYGSSSVFRTNLCAQGDNDQATCQGDSGGPMVIQEPDGSWLQIGLVSYGAATGCELGHPDVFTRVTAYLQWISEQTVMPTREIRKSGNSKLMMQQRNRRRHQVPQSVKTRPLLVGFF